MVKLMVIDDEKGICDFVADFFRRRGHQVSVVMQPQKAIEALEKDNPGIILLDIIMQPVNGIEVLKQIRAKDKKVKIIMVTISSDPKVKEQALKFGANDFVAKPFTTHYLESVVMAKIKELAPHE